jgi:hypothetical protein
VVSCRIVTKTQKPPVKTFPLVRRLAKSRGGEKKFLCAREERNTDDEVKRNPNPKTLPCDGAEESVTLNADDNIEATSAPEHQDLAELVWKYFEDEIREAMMEVQESLSGEKVKSRQDLSKRKQEGKR